MDGELFQLTGDNAVTISDVLAKDIKRHFKRDRDNRFKLFLLSHGASSLEERINFVEAAAEDGVRLVSEISAFVSKHMKFDG